MAIQDNSFQNDTCQNGDRFDQGDMWSTLLAADVHEAWITVSTSIYIYIYTYIEWLTFYQKLAVVYNLTEPMPFGQWCFRQSEYHNCILVSYSASSKLVRGDSLDQTCRESNKNSRHVHKCHITPQYTDNERKLQNKTLCLLCEDSTNYKHLYIYMIHSNISLLMLMKNIWLWSNKVTLDLGNVPQRPTGMIWGVVCYISK